MLIAGYVDLSIGSMVALIGIIIAKVAVATQNALLAVCVGLGLGFLLGLLNGLLVRRLEHLAADRDPGDAGALRRSCLRRQQHGGLRLSRRPCSSWDAARSLGIQYTVMIAVSVFVIGAFVLTSTVTGCASTPSAATRVPPNSAAFRSAGRSSASTPPTDF